MSKPLDRDYTRQSIPLTTDEEHLHPELKLVDCYTCPAVMRSAANTVPGYEYIPLLGGRCYGRAYCVRCLPYARRKAKPPESTFTIPTQEG